MPSKEVKRLQKEIETYTGRAVVSENVVYLTRKLAEFKAAGAAKARHAEPTVVVSISMPIPARDVLVALADERRMGVSELVRVALGEYLKQHGHRNDVAAFIPPEDV